MDKGICIYFGFNGDVEERIKRIKQCGFDSIITTADPKFNKQNGRIGFQAKLCKKYGLKLSSLHARYKNDELKYFFIEGKKGNKIEKNLIKDIKIAHKYGFRCVVAHMDGENNPIGLERLKRILNYSKKFNIPLAIENLDKNTSLDYIFTNINDEYLKFCYDSGHQHAYTPNRNILADYGDKLIALHLHDNDGTSDQHSLNQYGNIDWENLAKALAKYNPTSLDYELLLKSNDSSLSEEDVLNLCLKNALELEEKIKKYKKLIKNKLN